MSEKLKWAKIKLERARLGPADEALTLTRHALEQVIEHLESAPAAANVVLSPRDTAKATTASLSDVEEGYIGRVTQPSSLHHLPAIRNGLVERGSVSLILALGCHCPLCASMHALAVDRITLTLAKQASQPSAEPTI